ncbi:IS3 family transposase [Desulfosporosinus sp. FKB]|uniref:IS3 family transposase n=1 Tax=Desulfosporosinus sp. FKB TaxID=1969835 RepID=UPI000B4A5073|nr:IS3 family transposase [Desulfosporosinus sp. FKB]
MRLLSENRSFPVWKLCALLHITRSAYYRWLTHPKSKREMENERIAGVVEKIYKEHPDMGYRRIRDELDRRRDIHVNDKRVLRINRALNIQSTIKYKRHGCTKNAASPEYIAKNYLKRQFHADAPNSKWLTDVTEFKYYVGPEVHKLYLSAILDLYDRRIVAYAIGDRNDNRLVFDTFDDAVATHPEAHPLFHSDRGYQYTSRIFHSKLQAAGMKQSMSRVARCIDNEPMEGFWGILKRERYSGYKFTSREHLVQAISEYIFYYNYRRLQRRLYIMTPMEFHKQFLKSA